MNCPGYPTRIFSLVPDLLWLLSSLLCLSLALLSSATWMVLVESAWANDKRCVTLPHDVHGQKKGVGYERTAGTEVSQIHACHATMQPCTVTVLCHQHQNPDLRLSAASNRSHPLSSHFHSISMSFCGLMVDKILGALRVKNGP